MKRILILFLLLTNICLLHSQYLNVKKIGIEKGLSSNFIMSITQDNQGYMWFATESGLNRFDGETFRVFKKILENPNSLGGNELNKIYHNNGTIWIATQRSGLNAFDCNDMSFLRYVHNPDNSKSICDNGITDISPSADGNLWVSSYYQGFDYFNKETKEFFHYNINNVNGLPSNKILTIKDDMEGNVYLGHESEGLSIVNLKKRTAINFKHNPTDKSSLPGNEIKSLLIDSNGNVWIGTNNGLSLFNPNTQTFSTFRHNPQNHNSLLANNIFDLRITNDNRLWVCSENGGVSILDLKQVLFIMPESAVFSNICYKDNEQGLSNATIRCVFEDSSNNIWLGSYGGGINFINNEGNYFNRWTYSPIPNTPNSLSNKTAWGICIDKKQQIWIGTDGGGIDLFAQGEKIRNFSDKTSNLSSNAVLSALCDSHGNLWFGTYKEGLNYLEQDNNIIRQIPVVPEGKIDIRCLYEDSQQNLLVGNAQGVYCFNLNSKQSKFLKIKHSKDIRSILQDKKGNYWIGTYGNGIGVYDKNFNLLKILNDKSGFLSNTINHLLETSNQTVLAATGEGLVIFQDGKFSNFQILLQKDGLADNTIKAIAEDDDGYIWVSTNVGISKLNLKDSTVFNYNHLDGVPMGGFMSGSVAQSNDGTIYFGSQNGVCYFNPQAEPNISAKLNPVISGFSILERQVSGSELLSEININNSIKLGYSQSTFKILFNESNYALNEKVEFAYRLKGFDDNWYVMNGEKSVIFRNLSPGKYLFELKSRIRNSQWQNKQASLMIEITPPFWRTWWAETIYVLLGVTIILLLIQSYKRKLKRKNSLFLDKENLKKEKELNNEKLRFYTNVTHELRTPLTLILGPLEDIVSDRSFPQKHLKDILQIRKSANKLLALVNQILEFRKVESQNKKLCVINDNISLLLVEICSRYIDYINSKNVAFNISIEESMILTYDPEVITTIIDNLLSNAIKYTSQGQIELKAFKINEDYVEIEVRDTGKGIDAESLPKIFERYFQEGGDDNMISGTGIGLALVENLAKLHEIEISVKSNLHEGSSFKLRLKMNHDYPDAIRLKNKNDENTERDLSNDIDNIENKILILIIEDNKDIQTYIQSSLPSSYKAILASNGKEGIDEAFAHIPDIIVSDIMMPEMDGFELCRTLKEDLRTSHIPIILLTAKDSLSDKAKGYSLGADSYITKPFSSKLLNSRIINLIEARQKVSKTVAQNTGNKHDEYIESLSQLDNEFICKVNLIIHQHIDSEKMDIAFIANRMNMSHSAFYRKIKALTGSTANEFLRKVKIRHAEQLLLTGRYIISEVAYAVGMSSMTYFRQCFKDEFGISPSEYLRQLKTEKEEK